VVKKLEIMLKLIKYLQNEFINAIKVPKYEVVEPNGVPKYTIAKSRRVRSVNITNNFNKSLPHKIHVNFRAFGELFKLRLRRNYRLLSPTFTITEEMMDKDVTENEVEVGSNCYYHGYSSSHPNSSAAISMCDGMVREL
jgi:hypothetical protein